MTIEQQLIHKGYYELYTNGIDNMHPIEILAQQLIEEKEWDEGDLSTIRFAQGEVYFQFKDYESAMFKWEQVTGQLKPWAQKNIADAYLELKQFDKAEQVYQQVQMDGDVLQIEVLLQQFSLYIQMDRQEQAIESIKQAVALNPDYPDVTEMARAFFEKIQADDHAIELAVKEAVRTEQKEWFAVLESYVNQGITATWEPRAFTDVLTTLQTLNPTRFERLAVAMWKSYQPTPFYFSWLEEINQHAFDLPKGNAYAWKELSSQYKQAYFHLIDGRYLLKDFTYIIPELLANWLQLATTMDRAIVSTAILAWNDMFPSQLQASLIEEAEHMLDDAISYPTIMEDGLKLFESIKKWATANGVPISERLQAMVYELMDLNYYHLLIAGTATSSKSSFVNTLLNQELLEGPTSATVLFKDSSTTDMNVVTDKESLPIDDFHEFQDYAKNQKSLIRCQHPFSFLRDNQLALIETSGFAGQSQHVFESLYLADGVLFVLSAESILTGKELDMAVKIKEQAPSIPIHFLLSNVDRIASSQETTELVDKTTDRIASYFPNAKVFTFSKNDQSNQLLEELATLLRSVHGEHLQQVRTTSMLHYIKESITFLLEQRVEYEQSLIDTIEWNDEMVTKLQGTIYQLRDIEEEKTREIKQDFMDRKEEVRQELLEAIPQVLRDSADIITEDSDFASINRSINQEMNHRLTTYINEMVLPNFRNSMHRWIEDSRQTLGESKTFLQEMSESFHQLYGDENILLRCDERMFADWNRDVDRLTLGTVQLPEVNVLMHFNPSQFLLQSVGKLAGSIKQNTNMLKQKYKQYVNKKDYHPIAESVADSFMHQFELFENGLERDIHLFFADSFDSLEQLVEESQEAIGNYQEVLANMHESPELYRDPLTLFELNLRQYQWMAQTKGRAVKSSS
ncbi:GTP-binding protein [Aquibacillus sediminis]|uniref:GTP-binding protein n=1 Tax=Aquibacillus sediminis TaxID=2574734 RepID=UPI0011091D12|nr:GTP-binding protein [Aquibacillus sediminis]